MEERFLKTLTMETTEGALQSFFGHTLIISEGLYDLIYDLEPNRNYDLQRLCVCAPYFW